MKIYSLSNNLGGIELQGNSLIVYHRTTGEGVAGDICGMGFIAGGGASYGKGVYSTYNLKSSLQNYNLTTYGGQIVKAMVNVSDFLIFDYNIAKMIHGNNYRLTDQIKNVIGENRIINHSTNKDKQWKEITRISKVLNNYQWTSDYAQVMSRKYKLDRSGIGGVIFTGRHDGNVCVAYKEIVVTALAHAWIDGKTYKNPVWEKCNEKSAEELLKLQKNEKKARQFVKSRINLLKDLRNISLENQIDLSPENYPNIPESVFKSIIANFLYEDESRIQRLSPSLRSLLKNTLDVEFIIRKVKSAPTVYWNEWENMDEETKSKIPEETLIGIWTDFIETHHGYWSQIPDSIRSAIPKDIEAEYWEKLVKKNRDNWRYVHPEIKIYMQDSMGVDFTEISNNQSLNASDNEIPETEEIEIPSSSIGWVQSEIAKLNKRAGKLGLRPIVYEVVADNPKTRTKVIKIMGNIPRLKGWKLIARIARVKDEDGGEYNAVETLSDEGLPNNMDLANSEMRCDHCGHKRNRKECYIVKNEDEEGNNYEEGQYLMIGSTCLRDFIGEIGEETTPDTIAKYAQQFQQMMVLFKEGNKYQNQSDDDIRKEFKKTGVPIVFFLTKVMELDRQFGFIGRKNAYYEGKTATANLAWDMCTKLNVDQTYSKGVQSSDLATIYSALNWISNLSEDELKNEFLLNLKKSCELGVVFNKKRRGNAGIVAWLPFAYLKTIDKDISYDKIYGEDGDEIFFSGMLMGKRPVLTQVSQQVIKGKNKTQDYLIAKDEQGRIVAWLEDIPTNANIGETIYIKGIVEGNIPIEGADSTILNSVQEIPPNHYNNVKPMMEAKLKKLEEKENSKSIPEPIQGSPQGEYKDGEQIIERYTINGKKPTKTGQILYILKDDFGKTVSTFSDNNLGEIGEQKIISGTIQIKKPYVNLIGIKVIPEGTNLNNIEKPLPTPEYNNQENVEDDFTIINISDANYGSQLYQLRDSAGRNLSAFTKKKIGNIGETVRLKGVIKVKTNPYKPGQEYVNLTRVKVVPNVANPPVPPSKGFDNERKKPDPLENVEIEEVSDENKDPVQSNFNWYNLSRYSSTESFTSEQHEYDEYNIESDKPIEEDDQIEDSQSKKYKTIDEMNVDDAYSMFTDSYEKTTGKSWDKSKFINRAGNWLFFGNENGYIAVRPQRCGLYKLVGIAGNTENPIAKGKAIVEAFRNLMSENIPLWGWVSEDLKAMAEKMGMKSPSPTLMVRLLKYIPGGIYGGGDLIKINPDGSIQIEYSDVGVAKKYFIANDLYFYWLKNNIDSIDKIPKPAKFFLKKMIDKISSSNIWMKTASTILFVRNYIDVSELQN